MTDENQIPVPLHETLRITAAVLGPKKGAMLARAADEIERLRAQRDQAFAQLRHLIDDLTHYPNPDDPDRRYIRPGAGLTFSNMVNASAEIVSSQEQR